MVKVYDRLLILIGEKVPVALATIIEATGSTPQIAGSSALFSRSQLIIGTVGGGAVEATTQKMAFEALREGKSRLLELSLQNVHFHLKGAVCGGQVTILIDASPEKSLRTFLDVKRSLSRRFPGWLVTLIENPGSHDVTVTRHWLEHSETSRSELPMPLAPFKKELEKSSLTQKDAVLLRTKNRHPESDEGEHLLFIEALFPRPQLIIAGAGHIGQAVAHLGSLLDFEVTVLDDRVEFANRERFPEADRLIVGDIEGEIRGLSLTPESYLVIVTRDHRHDADALRACIGRDVGYIGVIGSQHKVGLMKKEFLEKGWATHTQMDRVHMPIGLPIQSKTVEEIAVSIAAQLVLVRHHNREVKVKEGRE